MSLSTYTQALQDGSRTDPLLGHAITPGHPVALAGEVVFVTREDLPAGRKKVRFFRASVFSSEAIILAPGAEFDSECN
jgi:hypothetical protein